MQPWSLMIIDEELHNLIIIYQDKRVRVKHVALTRHKIKKLFEVSLSVITTSNQEFVVVTDINTVRNEQVGRHNFDTIIVS